MRKLLMLGVAMLPVAAHAQSNVEGRVGRLESEMRAVQRKVFPGGGGQLLQPDITAPEGSSAPAAGTPATSAVIDLTSRVTSLEQQMATLTGQIEQNQYKLRTLQEQFDTYKRTNDARLATLAAGEGPGSGPAATSGGAGNGPLAPGARDLEDSPRSTRPGRGGTAAAKPVAGPRTIVDSAQADKPAGGASGITKPDTGDAAEDGYTYGYRLWQAKRYTEAETQLKKVVADYPKSRRASYAQNLLGRSYLDDGKPSLASMAFYDNYKKMPDGERAPDSLLYLGTALMKLNKPADACKVYGELDDVYGAKLSAGMKAEVVKGRAAAKCN